jgi:hypothetical protein
VDNAGQAAMVGLTVDKATDDLAIASSVKTRVAMTYMGNGGSEAAITRAHGCGGVDDRLRWRSAESCAWGNRAVSSGGGRHRATTAAVR